MEIKDLQEQRFKEELDLLVTKDKLERLKKERERVRFLVVCDGNCSHCSHGWFFPLFLSFGSFSGSKYKC